MTKLRAGDWVEVRTKEEILSTLDSSGRFEGLPFMPQMFKYCGKRFKVYKRSHKTCDTVTNTGGRWLPNGIHLELRCDGEAYGGCQAACLIFWKEAWLRPINERANAVVSSPDQRSECVGQSAESQCTEENVLRGTRIGNSAADAEIRYSCQATELPRFTTLARWWDVRQYVEDYTSRNASLGRIASGFVYLAYWHLALAKRARLGHVSRLAYDFFQELRGGIPFPRWKGKIPHRHDTPTVALNLQPGELVRVKSYKDILATVDAENINRGMAFDAELVPYCGGVYRVKTRITRFIDEKTGKMRSLKTPAVILEDVWCRSRYSNCKMFCPRSIYSWWREVWLERVTDTTHEKGLAADGRLKERSPLELVDGPHAPSDAGKIRAMEH